MKAKTQPIYDHDTGDLDPDYKSVPMVLQLHKMLDSEGNLVEIGTVVTDDQTIFRITFDQARKILYVANAISVKHRKTFYDQIQTRDGLMETLIYLEHIVSQAKAAGQYESGYEKHLEEHTKR